MIPLAPAIPTWRTASGGLSAMCRAVAVAASTGPDPAHEPFVVAELDVRRCDEEDHARTLRAAQAKRRVPRRLGQPLLIGRVERDGEEAAGSRATAGSTRAARERPLPGASSSTTSRSRRRPRRSSTQPAARAFLTQFRSPYGATSQRSPPRPRRSRRASTKAFPCVRPGTVRRWVRGPVSPRRASGRTSALSPRRHMLAAVRPRRDAHRPSIPARAATASSAVAAASGRGEMTRDQCARGRCRVALRARIRPSARAIPMPNPMPTCGQSRLPSELATEVDESTGWNVV